jgi:hypothetical protein
MRVHPALRVVLPVFMVLAVVLPFGYATLSSYRSYAVLIRDFHALAAAYPSLVTYEVIGRSVLGRDILLFKIGNPAGGAVLFDGTMHGDENLGGELLYFYAQWLLTSDDPLATRILQRDYTLLLPVLNVDGMQLGSRRNAHGVDLNRNFATNWDAASDDPANSTYRGPAPLSEPEAQALMAVFQRYEPRFYVNLHMWAGPYYAGSVYAATAYYASLVAKINALSEQRGVAPYAYWGQFRGTGYAIGDAAHLGIFSFLVELGSTLYPPAEIETAVLPRFLPVAVTLSQACEGVPRVAFPHVWDIDRDGLVTLSDASRVVAAYGATATAPTWDFHVDLLRDGVVNIYDAGYLGRHYGEVFDTLRMPFDDGNLTVAHDASGYANHGAIAGATWTAEGASGGAYVFDGDAFMTVPDAPSLDGNGGWGELTVELWVKPAALLHGSCLVAKKDAAASVGSYMIGFQSASAPANTLFFGVTVNGHWEAVVDTHGALAVDHWSHVLCTYASGTGLTIYVDGVARATRSVSGVVNPGGRGEPLFIGWDGTEGGDQYFVGQLDGLGITPAALAGAPARDLGDGATRSLVDAPQSTGLGGSALKAAVSRIACKGVTL